jgi:soluble lytic murein transglycosylase-like protein
VAKLIDFPAIEIHYQTLFHFKVFIMTKLFSLLCFTVCLLLPSFTNAATDNVDAELVNTLKNAIADTSSFNDKFEAKVWLTLMSGRLEKYNKMGGHEERLKFLELVHIEATKAGLEPELVLSVIHVESWFKREAVSSVGALGYMQIMPFWKKEIGRDDDDLFDMQTNLRYGCTILAHYLKRENGNMTRALGRYNGSYLRIKYPLKVHKKWTGIWKF